MLEHGGMLRQAAARYGRPPEAWLDLSTGLNPRGWPVPRIPAWCWSRLPEDDDGLERVARMHYGVDHILPVAGSQAAIQALPRLRPPSLVAVLDPGYAEHVRAWRHAGHVVRACTADRLDEAVARSDVVVLIHPNNPTGARFPLEQLVAWHARLAARNGWLVVDEAFMDATPAHSLCGQGARPGLIVLRSLGKFFGLAGARVGFVVAHPALLGPLRELLGPWHLSAPARWIAAAALADRAWQETTRQRLRNDGMRLRRLLDRHRLGPTGGCDLFQWICTANAPAVHEALAQRGILIRLFADCPGLRFGLPGRESEWRRLARALTTLDLAPGVRPTWGARRSGHRA
ncbi:MAG: threonine-phosphate decarboxylase [Rhodocyclaceae bacterium]|nr:threonine-phosphate decarboxylase [Rhodocyclaceae bacterium]